MADVSVKYKGAEITSIDSTGTKTLKTAGKYCESDVIIDYIKPQGGLAPVAEVDGAKSLANLRFDLDANTLDSGLYFVCISFVLPSIGELKCLMWLFVKANTSGAHTYTTGNIAKPSNACNIDGTQYVEMTGASSTAGTRFNVSATSSSAILNVTDIHAKLYRAEDVFA